MVKKVINKKDQLVTVGLLESALERALQRNNIILLDKIDTKIEELALSTKQGFDEMEERFEKIDRRFDGIDLRLDGVNVRLSGLDRRMDDFSVNYRRKKVQVKF